MSAGLMRALRDAERIRAQAIIEDDTAGQDWANDGIDRITEALERAR
ncbi:hypothetical protein [Mycobacteroides abscessus]|nr:hypothetical protein [Mycobacteroides abscessus]